MADLLRGLNGGAVLSPAHFLLRFTRNATPIPATPATPPAHASSGPAGSGPAAVPQRGALARAN